eukprot:jgi/Tetstr1/458096/TSEL_044603.t1
MVVHRHLSRAIRLRDFLASSSCGGGVSRLNGERLAAAAAVVRSEVSHSDMGSRGCCGATGATCCPTPAACRNRPGALGINHHDRPAGHSPGAPPTADRALACHERLTKRHVWL